MEQFKLATRETPVTEDLGEIKKIAEELLSSATAAENAEESKKYLGDLDQVVEYYKTVSCKLTYDAARASAEPLKYAILTYFYKGIKVKESANRQTHTVEQKIVDTDIPIDLGDLYVSLSKVGVQVGKNAHWIDKAQYLNACVTKRVANDIGATVNMDQFLLSKIAREMDMGKNPASNTQLMKTMQELVDQMIGTEYKAISHDVNMVREVFSKNNVKSKTGIKTASHKDLYEILKKVMYRILTDGVYTVESKNISKK